MTGHGIGEYDRCTCHGHEPRLTRPSQENLLPERIYVSSSTDMRGSAFARLARATHLAGEVIRHCNTTSQDLAQTREEVNLLKHALLSLLNVMENDLDDIPYRDATAICCSALMKLGGYHSCDSFNSEAKAELSINDMSLAHDITFTCRDLLIQTSSRVVMLIENQQRWLADYGAAAGQEGASFCPWALNCVYQSAITLAWLRSAASAETARQYAIKRDICVDLLYKADMQWKVAGKLEFFADQKRSERVY